jgi:hypothetical protein
MREPYQRHVTVAPDRTCPRPLKTVGLVSWELSNITPMIIVKELLVIPPNQEGEAFLHWMARAGCLVESLTNMVPGTLTAEHLLLKNHCGDDPLIRCFEKSKEDLSSICSVKWAKLFKTSEDIEELITRIVDIRQNPKAQLPDPELISNLAEAVQLKRKLESIAEKIRIACSKIEYDTS